MKTAALFFPLTSAVIFVQSLTGAYTVLGFYYFEAHMTTGYVTGVFALLAMILANVVKPKYNALRYSSMVLFVLVVIQGFLGFSAETSDQFVLFHFGNFLVLYGISIAMVFYAFRWSRMSATQQQSRSGGQTV